jgi:hypothetical protein
MAGEVDGPATRSGRHRRGQRISDRRRCITNRSLKRRGIGAGLRFVVLDHGTVVPVWGCEDGGARARAARWNISMMTIRPPQQGHGGRMSGGDAASSTSVRAWVDSGSSRPLTPPPVRVESGRSTPEVGHPRGRPCAGSQQFTYVSVEDFSIVQGDMTGGNRKTIDRLTDSPLARVGLLEGEARRQSIPVSGGKVAKA